MSLTTRFILLEIYNIKTTIIFFQDGLQEIGRNRESIDNNDKDTDKICNSADDGESSFASKPDNFIENVRQTDNDLECVRERKRGRPRKNLQIQEKISNVSQLGDLNQ